MLLLEFLAVGTWAFWGLLCLAAIIMSEFIDHDHPGRATVVFFITLAVITTLGNFNPLPLILLHPGATILYAAAFLAVGTVWSVLKWFFWLRRTRRTILEIRANRPGITDDRLGRELEDRGLPTDLPPQVGRYKSRIMGWMILWPASMVWTVLNDPVRWAFEEIYAMIGGGMQRISDRVFRDVTVGSDREKS